MSVELSVLLPIYNEERVLPHTLAKVRQELEKVTDSFEIVCVDDGSRDGSVALLRRAQLEDDHIVVIELSRNFGKEAAMAAGLDHARGQAVLLLDADLQHPAELFGQMVDAWRGGAEVVNGVKATRGREGWVYGLMARLFNRLMGQAGLGNDFAGASDFKLLDRQVVEALRQCPERQRFFRGLVAWVGFRTHDVAFHVQERAAGETKWSTGALLRYSLRNLLSFSALPLRVIALGGFSTLLFAAGLAAWTLYRYLRGDSLAGFPTVILLQLIFGGLFLTCLGVMSLYLAEMFEEIKRRPLYLYRAPRGPEGESPQRSGPAPAEAPTRAASASFRPER